MRGELIVIIGINGSGKTALAEHILRTNIKSFDYGIVLSGSHSIRGDYKIILDDYIYDSYDEEAINKIMILQSRVVGQQRRANVPEKNWKNAFIVIDDLATTISPRSQVLNTLITRRRHYNITIIFVIHHVNQLSPLVRNSATTCYMFKSMNVSVKKLVYDSFGGACETKKEFFALFNDERFNAKGFCLEYRAMPTDGKFYRYITYPHPSSLPRLTVKF